MKTASLSAEGDSSNDSLVLTLLSDGEHEWMLQFFTSVNGMSKELSSPGHRVASFHTMGAIRSNYLHKSSTNLLFYNLFYS